MKYSTISEIDVINIILRISECWQLCGIISPSNIALLLKTSRYQVNKHIKTLKIKGLIQYKSIQLNSYDELNPPYNGYCLTDLGRKTFENELKELSDRNYELIEKCFGL